MKDRLKGSFEVPYHPYASNPDRKKLKRLKPYPRNIKPETHYLHPTIHPTP